MGDGLSISTTCTTKSGKGTVAHFHFLQEAENSGDYQKYTTP
jgi:hypothetical protein